MPTYELKCTECGVRTEFFSKTVRKINGIETLCLNCKRETIHQNIIGVANPIFKGKGFYKTDYKK